MAGFKFGKDCEFEISNMQSPKLPITAKSKRFDPKLHCSSQSLGGNSLQLRSWRFTHLAGTAIGCMFNTKKKKNTPRKPLAQALDQWEERLEALFEGRPYDILDAALTATISKFPVSIQPFRDMIGACAASPSHLDRLSSPA